MTASPGPARAKPMPIVTFFIDAMTNGRCICEVTDAVRAIDDLATVRVNLDRRQVEIEAYRSEAHQLGAAIQLAGYTPVRRWPSELYS